ncbi:uncharacterized protein H6S33_010537 [Morchella sextelata]|uniref:uncharacterized protein n=1 Tax=Morchella sextelata TaxID=1174677 RepID=UPI001D04EC73|nr:uncharacterized protein H6S33_010537 [Morchella sextelata]KAH0611272.1 hypothetical protein H6S33_010537 [Morchella sextelata]
MGEAEAKGSRDMVRFPEGKDRPRTRARGGAVVYTKAGTAVWARTEGRTATRVCTRTEVKVSTRTDRTTVGMLTEKDTAMNREAVKIITADAQGMRDSRRNVE